MTDRGFLPVSRPLGPWTDSQMVAGARTQGRTARRGCPNVGARCACPPRLAPGARCACPPRLSLRELLRSPNRHRERDRRFAGSEAILGSNQHPPSRGSLAPGARCACPPRLSLRELLRSPNRHRERDRRFAGSEAILGSNQHPPSRGSLAPGARCACPPRLSLRELLRSPNRHRERDRRFAGSEAPGARCAFGKISSASC